MEASPHTQKTGDNVHGSGLYRTHTHTHKKNQVTNLVLLARN